MTKTSVKHNTANPTFEHDHSELINLQVPLASRSVIEEYLVDRDGRSETVSTVSSLFDPRGGYPYILFGVGTLFICSSHVPGVGQNLQPQCSRVATFRYSEVRAQRPHVRHV